MPSAVRLSDAIEDYLAVCEAQNAKDTVASKRSTLLKLLKAAGNIYVRNLGPQHVDALLVQMRHKWQNSTRKTNMAWIGDFQTWLHSRRLLDSGVDILAGKRNVKVAKKEKTFIEPDEIPRFLDTVTVPRDRVLCGFGFYALLRVSEITPVKWGDVDFDGKWLHIWREKTDEADTLPLLEEMEVELLTWREELCLAAGVDEPDPSWPVVCGLRPVRDPNGRFYVRELSEPIPDRPLLYPANRVKELLVAWGIDTKGDSTHVMRRSGSKALLEMIEKGVHDESAMRVLQSMLGHKSLTTTEAYVDKRADRSRRNYLLRGRSLYARTKEGGGA